MYELISLSEFINDLNENKGGIVNLKYAAIDTISSFPDFVTEISEGVYELSDMIQFTGSHDWLTVPVLPHNKLGWDISDKTGSDGTRYLIDCGGIITKYKSAITKEFHKMKSKEFVLWVTDRDGNNLVLGSPDLPLKFSWKLKSGDSVRQSKVYNINFSVELLEPPMAQPA